MTCPSIFTRGFCLKVLRTGLKKRLCTVIKIAALRMTRKVCVLLTVLGIIAASAGANCVEAQNPPSEYQLKAAFLYNFTRFVEWPTAAFPDPAGPFALCVLGADPFGSDLDQTIVGKTVNERPLVVRRLQNAQDLGRCHLLFISASEQGRLPQIFAMLRSRKVLTVSEVPGFTESGGIINLLLEDQRILFEINLDAAEQAELEISSKLLRLAKGVKSKGSERKN